LIQDASAMTQPLVFIDGDQGTTGLQIHERLHGRTDLRLLTLPEAERKDPQRRAQAINGCDIAILCLPDDAARDADALAHADGELMRIALGEGGIPDGA